MNKKNVMFLLVFANFSITEMIQTRYLRHMTVFVQEELINNTEFSHTVKSDNGKSEEKFHINRTPVSKEEYYKEFESAQLSEMRKERERFERQKRARMSFVDKAQLKILEKLLHRLIKEIEQSLELLSHEQVKKYYHFDDSSVESMDQLAHMKHFINHKAIAELKELSETMDMLGLQEMFEKLETWPDKLENLFKDSVQNAIKQSDDTAALKELLTLVSQ